MTPYDAVMIGLVVAGMIWGAVRGVTWQIASIASLVLAYLFSHQVSAYLAPYLPGEPAVQRAGSMLAAYVVVSGGVFLAAWMVRTTLRKMRFEAYDRHLGMVLGGLEGSLLGVVGTLFVVSLAPGTREPIFSSFSGRVVSRVMDAAGPVLPNQVRDVLTPVWSRVSDPDSRASIARDDAIPTTPMDPPADGSPLRDLARGARSKIGRAVGDAVKAEFERMGDYDDERTSERR